MQVDILTFLTNHLHSICELVCLLVAIFYYRHLRGSFMKWVAPFLGFIFLAEIATAYLKFYDLAQSSISIYYVITIIELCFYGYVFFCLSSKLMVKRFIFFVTLSSIVENITSFAIYGIEPNPFFISLTISGFLLTAIATGYIHSLFGNDDNRSLVQESGFWIAIGVSLFFSGTSIVFSLHRIILENNLTLFGVRLYHIIPRICCVILYLSISIAIILCKKKTKTSLRPY